MFNGRASEHTCLFEPTTRERACMAAAAATATTFRAHTVNLYHIHTIPFIQNEFKFSSLALCQAYIYNMCVGIGTTPFNKKKIMSTNIRWRRVRRAIVVCCLWSVRAIYGHQCDITSSASSRHIFLVGYVTYIPRPYSAIYYFLPTNLFWLNNNKQNQKCIRNGINYD